MRSISIIDPVDTKDQLRRGTLRMAVEALVANTAEVDRLFATEEFADAFIRKAMERALNLWDDSKIIVRTSSSHEEGITIEETVFDKKSLEDVASLFSFIVTNRISIGDKVSFNFKGNKAEGFISRGNTGNTTVSVAFVSNTKWGEDEDEYI